MNHLSTLQNLKHYKAWLFQRARPKAQSLSVPDRGALFHERRRQAVEKGEKALMAISEDLKRGDRSSLATRIEQLNSSFDLVEFADEVIKFLRKDKHPLPAPLQTAPQTTPHQYLISSWFLADCMSYLTSSPDGYESLHLVTGIKIGENHRTLERMIKVPLKLASEVGALADQHALQKALIEMDGLGHSSLRDFSQSSWARRRRNTTFNNRFNNTLPLRAWWLPSGWGNLCQRLCKVLFRQPTIYHLDTWQWSRNN